MEKSASLPMILESSYTGVVKSWALGCVIQSSGCISELALAT